MTDKSNFYNILYDREDYVAIKNRKLTKDDNYIFIKNNASVDMLSNGLNPEYICINPVDIESDGSATSANIFTYRNFLFEEDGGIPIEEQRDKVKQSGLPYSTVVFSGNESAHHIVSLEESLSNEDEYRRWFKTIETILSQYNFTADSACKNPSRLSRAAEGINIKTGKVQDILEIRSRVSNVELLKWFESHAVHPDDFIVKNVEYNSFDGPDTADDTRRWEVAQVLMGKDWDYSSLGDGQREPARFGLTLRCKECGLSLSATQNYMVQNYPSSKGSDKTRSDVERVYSTREVTPRNIQSVEDWKAEQDKNKKQETHLLFDNLLNEEFVLKDTDDEFKDIEINEDHDSDLHRYMMVGNDIYFLANRRIYKRNLQTFTIHHRKADLLNVRRYTDFCNEPGYFNYQPIVNNHYNKFQMPMWKPREGRWLTIEHYLRHLTNNDERVYNMLLDYLQISLENPKQKLPILLLISYEKSSGKSTFFDLLNAIFGDNVEPVTPQNFELDWNTQWCEKHFVFIDEMEKIKDKENIGSKIKNLVYFPTISKNKKGDDTITVQNNVRLVMTSNQESGFIEIDEEEDRWFILKVPPRTMFNPNYADDMRVEVPHFIHMLRKRELSTKNTGRGWFNKKQLRTKALDAIVHNSKPQIEIDLDRFITEWFDTNKSKDECNFILKDFHIRIENSYKDKELKDAVHKLWGIINNDKYTAEDSFNQFDKKQKNWYTIKRDQVMTSDAMNRSIEDAFNTLSL